MPATEPLRISEMPKLTLKERDRRWSGLQSLMGVRGLGAIVVGSFGGRERLESYLIDDFLDCVVVLPQRRDAIMLTFSGNRLTRAIESGLRGNDVWVSDVRLATGGAAVGDVLDELGLAKETVGIVGYGPTAPGEMEGLLPVGFERNLRNRVPNARLVDFTRDLTDFILVKSEEEIALLKYAAQVSELACQAMIEAARPGVSEAEVFAAIMYTVYRNGCDTRYPHLSLHSGKNTVGWGVPRWTQRAEQPRIIEVGDLVQAEIHTMYGAQESQVQMSVAIDPVDREIHACEEVARRSYEAGLKAIRPGVRFDDVVRAMEVPIEQAGCWSKTPLLHTLTFGATGFTPVNREQLAGTREEWIECGNKPGTRRGDLVLKEGMSLQLEPNACLGLKRVNIGGSVLVSGAGAVPLNEIPTRVHHRAART